MMNPVLNGLFDQIKKMRHPCAFMKFLALLTAWFAIASASAQTNALKVRMISLQDCIQDALSKNLDLRIARYTPSQAKLDLSAAYAGYDPLFFLGGQHSYSRTGGGIDPTTHLPLPTSQTDSDGFSSSLVNGLAPFGTTYSLQGNLSESSGTIAGSPFDESVGSASITLAQPLLKNFWIDGTRLNIRVGKNRLKYSELGLKQTIMTTVTTVEKAYYDLIASRENVKVQEQALDLANAVLNENNKRVQFGAMTPLDAQDAEAQVASTQATLFLAQQSMQTQLEVIKSLISDDFAAWSDVDLVPVDTLSTNRQVFDLQQSWTTALTGRPDLLQSKLDLEQQGFVLKYNRNQLFPELDLVGSYGHNASNVREYSGAIQQLGNGVQPFYYYGAQISFPLANIGARAAYKKSKLTMDTLLLELKKLEQTIVIQVHFDIGTVNADYDNLIASHKAREFAEASLTAEQTRLQNGKSTTFTVLQKQSLVTSSRASEIQALTDYNKALAQLSLDEAKTLERLGINVDVK
jgi:outer membrane protein